MFSLDFWIFDIFHLIRMGKFIRGKKRKFTDNGREKAAKANSDAKHLIEYGESHPLDDKRSMLSV